MSPNMRISSSQSIYTRVRAHSRTPSHIAHSRRASYPVPALPAEESYLYFAFGANTLPSTMTRVRSVTPLAQPFVAKAYQWELRFEVPGAPFVEPGFATIVERRDDDDDDDDDDVPNYVSGVVWTLSKDDWERVQATETGYVVTPIDVVTDLGREKKQVLTLVWPRQRCRARLQPSKRYLSIIREGAQQFNMDLEWRTYLAEKVRAYDPSANEARSLGAALYAVTAATLAPLTIPLVVMSGGRNGDVGDAVTNITWDIWHDNVAQPLLKTSGGMDDDEIEL
ncbi:hypothetical protein PPROV_001001200 [Pycnococcus provasolii]|uniref:gamma-glutamylcyclotransferase n=1 Tax=Pycnococcus provasolii TaxID=41880 RepID=A0A830HVN4_9CHLO|nr:hypothetical protein PPROV_001001200 [Pycnococcus provasolii]